VLVVDDHPAFRKALASALRLVGDIEVAGEASGGEDACIGAKELQPDVVLMDLSMPGPHSGEVIRRVLQACPTTRVLILTMHDDAGYVASAMAAGAAGYVVKKAADSELLLAIHAVRAGRTFVDVMPSAHPPGRADPENSGEEPERPKDLSRREREVLLLLVQGHSNQQVADRLRVSVKTVETYRTRLRQKLGLRGRADLYRFATESGLLDGDEGRPPA
jgi:two-component system response regulator NreC